MHNPEEMLFDLLYSLLNTIMASTATIGPQENFAINGKAKGEELKENGGPAEMMAAKMNRKQNVAENGVKANDDDKADETKTPKALTVKNWDYNDYGQCGPQQWLKICGCQHLGDSQSPIDLKLSQMRILSLDSAPLCLVNYKKPLPGKLLNTGCSIQFLPDPQMEPPEIYGGKLDQNYRFIQYHFHWAQNDNEGSEHTIGGLRYPAELHLVHQGVQDPTKLAVLGIFLKLAEENGTKPNGHERKLVFDQQEMDAMKKLTDFEQKIDLDAKHCLAAKLPANCCLQKDTGAEHFVSSFVRYQGSLTTPPCTENVIWTVFTDPLSITREQLALLRAVKDCRGQIITKNYRPVQKLANREVSLMMAAALSTPN